MIFHSYVNLPEGIDEFTNCGPPRSQAAEASCQRLRALVLSSFWTCLWAVFESAWGPLYQSIVHRVCLRMRYPPKLNVSCCVTYQNGPSAPNPSGLKFRFSLEGNTWLACRFKTWLLRLGAKECGIAVERMWWPRRISMICHKGYSRMNALDIQWGIRHIFRVQISGATAPRYLSTYEDVERLVNFIATKYRE